MNESNFPWTRWRRWFSRIYALYLPLANWLRSRRSLTRALFGVVIPGGIAGPFWDWTTLVLKKALDLEVQPGHSVLDVGTGSVALLAIYIAQKKQAHAIAVDIVPGIVESALRVVEKNRAQDDVDVYLSDFFAMTGDGFDLVCFNSVYIPLGWGDQHHLTHLADQRQWCGGEMGHEVIKRFLEHVPRFLNPQGKVLLGFSAFYVPDKRVAALIHQSDLVLCKVVRQWLNPSRAYVLSHAG